MATVKVGYDANGNALDYTTHVLAVSGASSGDTIESYYGTNARLNEFQESSVITATDKTLYFVGKLPGFVRIFGTGANLFAVGGTNSNTLSIMNYYLIFNNTSGGCINIPSSSITNKTIILDKNVIVSRTSCAGTAPSVNNTNTIYIRNTLFLYGAIYAVGIDSGATVNIYIDHCTILNVGGYSFIRSSGTGYVYNTVILTNKPALGSWSGSHNACIATGGLPASNRIVLDWATYNPHFWRDKQPIGSMYDELNFDITTASCLYRAGTDRDIDYDILGRERHPTTPSIGAFEGQDLPTHPDKNNVRTGTTAYIDLYGATQTPSYSPDFPDVGNVRDTDTVDGVTGTLSSNKILKSNTTGSGAGNYNDDNLTASNVRKDVTFGLSQVGTLEPEAHTPNQVLKSAGGNYNDDNLTPDNVRKDVAFGLSQTGTLVEEIHTANQVLKSAGGNWNDDNLGEDDTENVRDGVAYGLGWTGTAEVMEQTPTPTYLDIHDAGDGLTYYCEARYGPVGGSDMFYSDDCAMHIYRHEDDEYLATVSASGGRTGDLPLDGEIVYIRVQEPGRAESDRYPAGSGYEYPALTRNYADPANVLHGRKVRVDGGEISGTSANLTASDPVYQTLEAGRNTDMAAENVKLNYAYTSRGNSRVGTYAGDDSIVLARPNLSAAVSGGSVTFTVSGATDGTTNEIYVRLATASAWPSAPAASISGNGSATVSLSSGVYIARVISRLGEASAPGANDPVSFAVINPGAEVVRSDFGEEFIASAKDDMLAEFGEPITYRRGAFAISIVGIRGDMSQGRESMPPITGADGVWEICVDDLDFGDGPATPALHDQIISSDGAVWYVMGDGEKDADNIAWVIPCRRGEYGEGGK